MCVDISSGVGSGSERGFEWNERRLPKKGSQGVFIGLEAVNFWQY
jgi:hypothetical protein